MNFKKVISSLLVSALFLSTTANASVLGSETVKHSRLDIGKGAVLETNVFYSDQSGVGYQTEYFVEYTPNKSVVPIVTNDSIYGRITASSMANSMLGQNKYPTMLMNSDFFALNTGIPLSHQVIDEKLYIMDTNDMDAIGINDDGTAFISWLSLNLSANVDDTDIDIDVFNKLRQPYGIYMYDSNFGDTTRNETEGINVVLGEIEGELKIGETLKATVESVTQDNGSVEIPKDKHYIPKFLPDQDSDNYLLNLAKKGLLILNKNTYNFNFFIILERCINTILL